MSYWFLRPKFLFVAAGLLIVLWSILTDPSPLYWADFLSFPHHEWATLIGVFLIGFALRFAP